MAAASSKRLSVCGGAAGPLPPYTHLNLIGSPKQPCTRWLTSRSGHPATAARVQACCAPLLL